MRLADALCLSHVWAAVQMEWLPAAPILERKNWPRSNKYSQPPSSVSNPDPGGTVVVLAAHHEGVTVCGITSTGCDDGSRLAVGETVILLTLPPRPY